MKCERVPHMEIIKNHPSRIILRIDIKEGGIQSGYNEHYTIHSDVLACYKDFVERVNKEPGIPNWSTFDYVITNEKLDIAKGLEGKNFPVME